MYITKGIIVDTGAAYVQDPLFDDKLKIRIPELHGFGNLVKSFQEENYTKDEDLPWMTLSGATTDYYSYYPILAYKAQNYGPADIVYVQVDNSDSVNSAYQVIGLYAEYSDGTEETLTIYNGLDVSKIIESNVEFPEELLVTYTTDDDDDNPDDGDNPDYDNDNTIEEWKYFFSNPFASKSDYRVSWEFGAKHPKGYYHAGIDLAGPEGTPIYSVADGEVIKSNFNSAAGNIIAIKHVYEGKSGKATYYSVYEHLQKRTVSVGDTVKGAHYISDTEYKSAYKKEVGDVYTKLNKKPADWDTNYKDYYTDNKGKHKNNNSDWDAVKNSIYAKTSGTVYTKLKSKPLDWDNGGWTNYYKNTGSSKNPKYEKVKNIKQQPTKIGTRDSTGTTTNSSHLHFGIATIKDKYYRVNTGEKNMGGLKNPRKFISF